MRTFVAQRGVGILFQDIFRVSQTYDTTWYNFRMEAHDIHGTKIGFHGSAGHALFWLRDEMHRDGLEDYLKIAKDKGHVHFTDGRSGHNYTLKHDKTADSFSVERNYSTLYK